MEVVVLAGGFGTRIRPLTYTRPKPLLPILNQPMLAHIIQRLPAAVTKIVLPVNYLREQIEAHFQDHPDPRVILVEEPQPLGTGGAIKNCEDELTGPFLVVNGDVVSGVDLAGLWRQHEAKRAKATISLWPVEDPWHYGVVRMLDDGRIVEFVEKPPQGKEPSSLINAGHYALDLDVLDDIPPGRMVSIERELYAPWAREGKPIYGFPIQGYWVDCGRPESLLTAHRAVLAADGQRARIDPSAHVSPRASFVGYALGARCRLDAGSRVERSILLPDVHVGKDVVIVDSILGEGVEVEGGAHLERVVVGDYGIIQSGSKILDHRVGLRPHEQEEG